MYVPVAQWSTLRVVLALAVTRTRNSYNRRQDGISSVECGREDALYVGQPEGFVKQVENGEEYFCRWHESMLWVRQTPDHPNGTIHEWLVRHGFGASSADLWF